MGNGAIALGALAAGLNLVAGYPGTPSSEILETVAKYPHDGVHVEWSVNEKAAMEVAASASYSGARTLVTMKQVGLNVASDPLMSLAYVGIKGGTASANHAHMDAGSFVFEAQGVRWAQDLGMQEYYSLEKEGVRLWNGDQDGQRWDVFRYNNFVHNTLTVNGEKHQVKGAVPILATYTKDARLGASLDMTSLFGSNLKKATREVVLVKEQYLQVTDQVQAAGQPASVRWTMVTSATPKLLDSHTIELTKEGKKLHVIIDSPSAAAFSVVDNVPSHSYDAPNPGSVRIVFDVDVKAGRKETLKVRLVPVVE